MNAICPSCGEAKLVPKEERKAFKPPSVATEVVVTLSTSICENCGARMTTKLQRANNLQALASRRAAYGEWLTGEEVLELRKKYGITQQQASEIFGKGKIAFSRYENEVTYPDLTMTRLMRLALEDAGVMKRLARASDIQLPLLEKRLQEDLVRSLLKVTSGVKPTETAGGPTTVRLDTASVGANLILAAISAMTNALAQPASTKAAEHASQVISASNDERFALAA